MRTGPAIIYVDSLDDCPELDCSPGAWNPLCYESEERVMTSEQAQDTRTAVEVMLKELRDLYGGYIPADDEAWLSDAEDISAVLAAAGYTMAGPGQVVVDRERWERVQDALVMTVERDPTTALRRSKDQRAREMKWLGIQPGDLDPLPTQEGE
jgi:hypothetical protein